MTTDELTQFYIAFIGLLLSSKQQVIRVASKYDLTAMQAMGLIVVSPSHPPTMQEMASIFGCDASNVTGIVDGLESKKLVSRQEKPGDRRVKVVRLEALGEKIRTQILHEAGGENGENFMRGLDEGEKKQFAQLVNKITRSCPFQSLFNQLNLTK